jgi:hypothetical protein
MCFGSAAACARLINGQTLFSREILLRRDIAEELKRMYLEDVQVRERLQADGTLFQGYHSEMENVHHRNSERLQQIIKEHGWPGRTSVGDEAAYAAWMILQHSIGEPGFLRQGFSLIHAAAAEGEIDPKLVAMIEDRICMCQGKAQKYGTQFDWDANGEMSPVAHDDLELVEERRRKVGLPPLAEAIEKVRAATACSNERPPADHSKRLQEMNAWARQVGWRS